MIQGSYPENFRREIRLVRKFQKNTVTYWNDRTGIQYNIDGVYSSWLVEENHHVLRRADVLHSTENNDPVLITGAELVDRTVKDIVHSGSVGEIYFRSGCSQIFIRGRNAVMGHYHQRRARLKKQVRVW